VKAFTFGLEQALRWRETQVRVQKSRVAAAAGHADGIRTMLDSRRAEAASGAAQIIHSPTGMALASYAGFMDRSRVRISDLETKTMAAQRTVAVETERLLDANRKLRLLENLKRAAQDRWQRDFDRELATFTDEAFLARQHSKGTIGKRTGA
jgi:flagellar export protein FliJ